MWLTVGIVAGSIVGLFLLTLGTRILLATRVEMLRARASRNWPRVPGRVTVSEPEARSWRARIRYEYTVDRTIEGSMVGPGLRILSREGERALLERYPVGAEVDVYYDPTRPTIARLVPGDEFEPGVLRGVVTTAALCVIIAAVDLGWVVWAML